MDLKTKRWIVLIVSCVVNVIIGTGYAWSVFATPWARLLFGPEATGAQVALVFGICNSVGPITMIAGGKINDALGPKWVVFVGGLMFGGGIFLAGFGQTEAMLYIGYSIIFGLAMGLIYSCTIGNTVKWFPDKRGLVGGLTTAAYGIGSVLLAFIISNTMTVDETNVAKVFMVLGVIYAVVVCVGAFFITPAPAGYIPEGWTPPAPAAGMKAPEDKTWNQMLADPIFYVMILTLLAGAFFGLMMISNASPIAQKTVGFTPATAGLVVTALALCNTGGRVVCGWVSDLLGRINTLAVALVLAVVGLFLVKYGAGNGIGSAFVIGVCIVGFTFGAFMGVYPGFTADQFGPKNNGINYGIMFIGFAVAGWFGPKIVSSYATAEPPYDMAFTIAIVIAIVGLALTFLYRAMSRKKA